MRKYTFTMLFLICSFSSYSQLFAPLGATWHYGVSENPMSGPQQGYVKMQSSKDSIVNLKKCKVLKVASYSSNGSFQNLKSLCFYQENSKVFQFIYGRFFLLYDFSVKKGDTLKLAKQFIISGNKDTTFQTIVDSVGSKVISGKLVRYYRTKTDLGRSGTWFLDDFNFEFMGNLNYMFPQNELSCDAYCYNGLRCYADSSIKYSSGVPCTKLVMGIDEVHPFNSFVITLAPNPVDDSFTINSENPFLKGQINVMNMYGHLLQIINLDALTNSGNEINFTGYPSGLYFLTGTINEVSIFKKVVKN
jgi:hypothetical protein